MWSDTELYDFATAVFVVSFCEMTVGILWVKVCHLIFNNRQTLNFHVGTTCDGACRPRPVVQQPYDTTNLDRVQGPSEFPSPDFFVLFWFNLLIGPNWHAASIKTSIFEEGERDLSRPELRSMCSVCGKL